VNQGCLVDLVDHQFSKALIIPWRELLKQKVRATKKIFLFVTTFSPMLPDLNHIIKKHLHFLESSPKLKELFPKNSIIPSYCRSKNLKEILAPSKFISTTSRNTNSLVGGCFKCDKNRCDLCKHYFVEISVASEQENLIQLDLISKNIIYLVSCKKCQVTLAQQQQNSK